MTKLNHEIRSKDASIHADPRNSSLREMSDLHFVSYAKCNYVLIISRLYDCTDKYLV